MLLVSMTVQKTSRHREETTHITLNDIKHEMFLVPVVSNLEAILSQK